MTKEAGGPVPVGGPDQRIKIVSRSQQQAGMVSGQHDEAILHKRLHVPGNIIGGRRRGDIRLAVLPKRRRACPLFSA